MNKSEFMNLSYSIENAIKPRNNIGKSVFLGKFFSHRISIVDYCEDEQNFKINILPLSSDVLMSGNTTPIGVVCNLSVLSLYKYEHTLLYSQH